MSHKHLSGFTLVEMLLVVALLLIVSASALPLSAGWFSLGNFDSAVSSTVSSLRKAQIYAINRYQGQTWGLCRVGNTIRLFSGSCNSPVTKNDFELPSGVEVTGLDTAVTFSSYRGEPSRSLILNFSGGGKTAVVSLNPLGGMQIQ